MNDEDLYVGLLVFRATKSQFAADLAMQHQRIVQNRELTEAEIEEIEKLVDSDHVMLRALS